MRRPRTGADKALNQADGCKSREEEEGKGPWEEL